MQDRTDSSHEGGGLLPRQTLSQETWLIPAAPGRISDFMLLVFGLALFIVLLLLVMPAKRILDRYEERLAPSSSSRLDGYSAETEKLQKKVLDLVTASIETRLRGIETDIRTNKVTPGELQTLEELKQELKVLAAYSRESAGNSGEAIIRGGVPMPNSQLLPDEQKREMREELAQLKNLFYVSLLSCGAMVLLVGAYWLQTRRPRVLSWDNRRAFIVGQKTRT
jgi:hypothetical protein